MNQRITALLKAALECSVYVAPDDPGLTFEELRDVGRRAGFQDGEINDAMFNVGESTFGSNRVMPGHQDRAFWHMFMFMPERPDYRNIEAFDFVFNQLNGLVRSEGVARATVGRDVLTERAVAANLPRHDIKVAIAYLLLADQLLEKDGYLRFRHQSGVLPLPSSQIDRHRQPRNMPEREKAYPLVKDIVSRRTDGRPASAEPFDDFASRLIHLGYEPFQLWWRQTVAELRVLDASTAPVSVTVLSAALVEGALTFIVNHARKSGLFQSSDYDREPSSWRIDKLVNSAASGGDAAIFSASTKARVEILVRARQRIHAGRMISDFNARLPDIRPDEARDVKATAEHAVRAILDWLHKHPTGPSG